MDKTYKTRARGVTARCFRKTVNNVKSVCNPLLLNMTLGINDILNNNLLSRNNKVWHKN